VESLILVDTTEVLRPGPRKLHAAWAELDGRKLLMPPTVATELAPLVAPETHPTFPRDPATPPGSASGAAAAAEEDKRGKNTPPR
jgi:hypothetical protein